MSRPRFPTTPSGPWAWSRRRAVRLGGRCVRGRQQFWARRPTWHLNRRGATSSRSTSAPTCSAWERSFASPFLTGRPAFVGQNVRETLSKASRGGPGRSCFAQLDISGADRDLIELAKHCLAPERVDRPPTAQQVVQRVTAHLTGVQERLRKAELASVEERARRRITLAVTASILGILILGGGGWAYLEQLRAGRCA